MGVGRPGRAGAGRTPPRRPRHRRAPRRRDVRARALRGRRSARRPVDVRDRLASPRPSRRCCWPTASFAATGGWPPRCATCSPRARRCRRAPGSRSRSSILRRTRRGCPTRRSRSWPDRVEMLRGRDPYARLTTDGLLRALGRARLKRTPGTGSIHYSNLGVGVLGLALANATATPYADLLDEPHLPTARPGGHDGRRTSQRRAAFEDWCRGIAVAGGRPLPGRSTGCPRPAR